MNTSADSVRVAHPLFQAEGGGSIPTSALDLNVCEISPKLAQRLNYHWHSALPKISIPSMLIGPRKVFYGIEHGGIWYAVAIWTQPVAAHTLKGGKDKLELRRLAIATDAPKNTASRIIAIMTRQIRKKWPELTCLISYQATDVHQGTIYKASGWVPVDTRKNPTRWHVPSTRPARDKVQNLSPKIRWEKWL